MMTDSEFFNFTQREAAELGLDGDQLHRSLVFAHRDLITFIESVQRLAPDSMGVGFLEDQEPCVYANWIDEDSGAVFSLQFFEDRQRMAVYEDMEVEEVLMLNRFTEKSARLFVFLFSPMPTKYTQ